MARKLLVGLLMLLTGTGLIGAGLTKGARTSAAPGPAVTLADWADTLIRLHVVANSDSEEDQALKRAVRDRILAEVTPLFEHASSADEARAIIRKATPQIEAAAAEVVAAWGQTYTVKAELGQFNFPGKAYGENYLPAGEYTALKVRIGAARGANWWCILYPPLCFVDWSTGVVLEPKPGSGGTETVTVPRKDVPQVLDEEQLNDVPVRARFAVVEWVKAKLKRSEPQPAAPRPEPSKPVTNRQPPRHLRIPSL